MLFDYTFSFSEGRVTSIDPERISQRLPRDDDWMSRSTSSESVDELHEIMPLHSPFPHLARLLLSLGRLNNTLNILDNTGDDGVIRELSLIWRDIKYQYDALPLDMNWTAAKYVMVSAERLKPISAYNGTIVLDQDRFT